MKSIINAQRFCPTHRSADNAQALANEFHQYLEECGATATGDRPMVRRVVYVISDNQSEFGFKLAASLAKQSHLCVDLFEVAAEADTRGAVIPEIVTLAAAGIRCEHHFRAGQISDWLPDHLVQYDDTAAVVVEAIDLHRAGVLSLEHVLTPGIIETGLPVLLLVDGGQLLTDTPTDAADAQTTLSIPPTT